MEEKKTEGIPPYRAAAITKAVADITERIVTGKYIFNPTYHECEIIIELVGEALKKCKNEYRRK